MGLNIGHSVENWLTKYMKLNEGAAYNISKIQNIAFKEQIGDKMVVFSPKYNMPTAGQWNSVNFLCVKPTPPISNSCWSSPAISKF